RTRRGSVPSKGVVMPRPFLMWIGVVVLVGVLVGCNKEKSTTTAGANTGSDSTPAANTPPVTPGPTPPLDPNNGKTLYGVDGPVRPPVAGRPTPGTAGPPW